MRGRNRPILNDNLGQGFHQFLRDALKPMLEVSRGAIYIAMSSSELDTLQAVFRQAGGKWSTFIIWAKNTFTLGRADYQRQYGPILYGWKDRAKRHSSGAGRRSPARRRCGRVRENAVPVCCQVLLAWYER